ncbi:helix-turn-helix domain-containing protein [Maricurvus nonylphenolicus]|uniref:winged helix-turn-helix transcriptional regulator n=1 Tax=Maricurvus nonylphenolicus TaxID=1008307 RepID=UPI0036F3037B
MKWEELPQQQCSIARSLSVVGDRWTLLILSDSFLGVKRFEAFRERLGISRTILSDRLNLLEQEGVIRKQAYQEKPTRYEYRLTSKGRDLYPVILSLLKWGDSYYADEAGAPILVEHQDCGHDFHAELVCSHCKDPVSTRNVKARKRPEHPDFPTVERGPAPQAS